MQNQVKRGEVNVIWSFQRCRHVLEGNNNSRRLSLLA
jgi:hypothetical protein